MITKELFGKKPCGCEVYAYTLTNKNGASVQVLSMGGILRKIEMPDRNGNMADVICGFDSVEGYLTGGGYQGALIGRYGNRIKDGRFTLNGVTYQLACNDANRHLHGGNVGFNQKIWDVVPFETAGECGLILGLVSEDGEENYPGRLEVKVTYTLTDKNELKIHYEAVSDKDTVINMTNHSYFNLAGFNSGSVLSQYLWVDSDAITEIDGDFIPTGKEYPAAGTPFDFNTSKKLGDDIEKDDVQLAFGGGYDHNFIFKTWDGTLRRQAEMYDEKSGRVMTVYTDQPGVQLYSGNMMTDPVPMKGGMKQERRLAICLETQHAPDSPNHDNFPTTKLCAGEKYDTTTVYAFGVK